MTIKQLTGLFTSDRLGRVYGGPFREIRNTFVRPNDFTVKMAVEIDALYHAKVDCKDFQVPKNDDEVKYALLTAAMALAEGRDVLVGCMGGVGRTGMFLTILTAMIKRINFNVAVQLVRAGYNSHAVETQEQMQYVATFLERYDGSIGYTVRCLLRPRRIKPKAVKAMKTPLTKVA